MHDSAPSNVRENSIRYCTVWCFLSLWCDFRIFSEVKDQMFLREIEDHARLTLGPHPATNH